MECTAHTHTHAHSQTTFYDPFSLLLLLLIIILLLHSPIWILASFTILLHSFLSFTSFLRFLTGMILRSSPTLTNYLFFGLPLFLVIRAYKVVLHILLLSMCSTWPSQLICIDFMYITMPSSSFSSFISALNLICQTSSPLIGSWIHLITFLSETLTKILVILLLLLLLLTPNDSTLMRWMMNDIPESAFFTIYKCPLYSLNCTIVFQTI